MALRLDGGAKTVYVSAAIKFALDLSTARWSKGTMEFRAAPLPTCRKRKLSKGDALGAWLTRCSAR